MRIRLIGQRNFTGIGTHYACFADALGGLSGIGELIDEVDFQNLDQVEQAIRTSQPTDINISFVAANIDQLFQGFNIQWIVFESTRLPDSLIPCLKNADQTWVPSRWGRDVLINNGIDPAKIRVVPEGVDPARYHPLGRPHNPTGPVTFLFVGKYEERKSCRLILDAWAQALGNDARAQLIFKTNYFVDAPAKVQELRQHVEQLNLTNLVAIWDHYTDDQLLELYRRGDVFVFPTRGEGWGLPIIEAAAQGMPVIVTDYSAQHDYLADIADSCVFVDYELGPVNCPEFQRYYPSENGWGEWAYPSEKSLISAFRTALENHAELAQRARKNSEILRKNWSWANSADQALAVMEQNRRFRPG